MQVFTEHSALQEYLKSFTDKQIGFVPTMGALHEGHVSLIKRSKTEGNITVCSIFVNPTQFNDPADLEKYPRTLSEDSKMLEEAGCDALYAPAVTDVYPRFPPSPIEIELDNMATVMEGKFRPGHFIGMLTVVKRLFDIVSPHVAYFGEKDFQQLAIVKYMVDKLELPIRIVGCETVREDGGLAMSSRNRRLSAEEREAALLLSKALNEVKRNKEKGSVEDARKAGLQVLKSSALLQPEYLEIVDAKTLQAITSWADTNNARTLVAAKVNEVRLIDNIPL